MAAIFASKTTDKEEGLYVKKASLNQSQPIPNSAQFPWDRLRSSTKTQVKDEVDHNRRQLRLTESDNAKARVQQREQFHRFSEQELGNQEPINAPLSTQCIRHDQAETWSSLQSGSPFENNSRSGKVDCDSELDNDYDIDSSTPPPPSDLEALGKTWEQVKLYHKEMSKSISAASQTRSISSEETIFYPRGGRIDYDGSGRFEPYFRLLWKSLCDTAKSQLKEDNNIEIQLRSAEIWLSPETYDEGLKIEAHIERLMKKKLTVEEEWSDCLWKRSFFNAPLPNDLIEREVQRRQTHTLNRKQSTLQSNLGKTISTQKFEDPVDVYPPVIGERVSLPCSPSPYTVDPDRMQSGHVLSDVSYGIPVLQEYPEHVKYLPTFRLYKDGTHYLENEKVEIKPEEMEDWRGPDFYKHSVQYLTLTGMTMMHEWLKLCYMASNDMTFFAQPGYFCIHLISAVGYTARHYIHGIRPDTGNGPVKYISYCLSIFDLRQAEQRNEFRVTLNHIRVLQITAYKDVMQRQVEEILALDRSEIHRRLQERAHKNVRFHHSRCGGKLGFCVKQYSSSAWSKISPKSMHAHENHIDIDVHGEQAYSILSPRPPPRGESEGKEISNKESFSGTASSKSLSSEPDNDEKVGQQFSKRVSRGWEVMVGNARAPEGKMSEVLDKTLTTKGRKRYSELSTDQTKDLSESVLAVRIRPAEPKAKLKQSNSNGSNTQTSRVPSYMKPTVSNTTKAQRLKGNKDGMPVATGSASRASTLEERTRDGRSRRRQAWLKERQCGNASLTDGMACWRKDHQASFKNQLAHNPHLPCSISLSPIGPSRDSQ